MIWKTAIGYLAAIVISVGFFMFLWWRTGVLNHMLRGILGGFGPGPRGILRGIWLLLAYPIVFVLYVFGMVWNWVKYDVFKRGARSTKINFDDLP